MATVVVRPAEVKDAPGIAIVHVRSWQFAYRGQLPDEFLDTLSIETRTIRWQRLLTRLGAHEQNFIAEVGGVISGFCSVGKCRDHGADETCGEVYAIYVHPDQMGHGVGSTLMDTGYGFLLAQGFTRLTLWVLESNQPARRFYESKGWALDDTNRIETIGGLEVSQLRYAIHLPQA